MDSVTNCFPFNPSLFTPMSLFCYSGLSFSFDVFFISSLPFTLICYSSCPFFLFDGSLLLLLCSLLVLFAILVYSFYFDVFLLLFKSSLSTRYLSSVFLVFPFTHICYFSLFVLLLCLPFAILIFPIYFCLSLLLF